MNSLLLTLFGGMTLTVVFYGLARLGRLSNFWAAVVAAGIPCFAYFGVVFATQPGLDRITMHLIAYPTVAVLLYQLYRTPGRTHWVPLALVSFFVVLSVLLGGFVYIASEGVSPSVAAWLLPNAKDKPVYTAFSGVVAHDDEAAKSIAHRRNMESQVAQRGWQVEVSGIDALQRAKAGVVTLRVMAKTGGVTGLTTAISVSRPGQDGVREIALNDKGDGVYSAPVAALGAGLWVLTLVLDSPGQRPIRLEQAMEVNAN